MLKKRSDTKLLVVRLAAVAAAALAVLLLLTSHGAEAADGKDLAEKIIEMTGARTKIVWQHQLIGPYQGSDSAAEAKYELMGFDTKDGRMRQILPGPASYANPCFTRDGSRIIFNDAPAKKAYSVDWDGRNKKFLRDGFATCTWVDPKTGIHWVYAGSGSAYSTQVVRFQLDNPQISELVWNAAPQSFGLRVSADGTRGASEFPWPLAGMAMLPNISWKQYGTGCNTDIAPDNSYRVFHMERGGGAEGIGHNGVVMYDAGGTNRRRILFNIDPERSQQPAWIPRWTTDVQFLTTSWPDSGAQQQNQNLYLGEFNGEFTQITRWLQITNRPGKDISGYAWIAPGLGSYSGEPPVTVKVPSRLAPKGQWQWDYGDGTKEKSAKGAHTYTEPGSYIITAQRRDVTIRGRVTVHDRKPPRVTAACLLDDTHVQVTFDEPVQLKDAKVALRHPSQTAPAAPVKSFQLDREGIELAVELNAGANEGDVLILEGIYDRAPAPNTLANNKVAITLPPWPGDRRRLVVLWETADAPNIYFDRAADAFRPVSLNMIGMARFDRYGAILFEGGAAVTPNTGGAIFRSCTAADQLGIEATITTAAAQQGNLMTPTRILAAATYRRGREQVYFALHQEEDVLVFYIRSGTSAPGKPGELQRVRLCPLPEGVPSHIVMSYAPGDLACYLNGRQVKHTDEVTGKLSWGRKPGNERLYFGGAAKGNAVRDAWEGALEGIAVYGRTIAAEKARKDYDEYSKRFLDRKPVEQLRVRAKLVAKSNVPNAADIAPYHSALVVCEYEIEEILDGTYEPKKIRAAMWGLVHKKKTRLARAKPGDVSALTLEKLTDHPELQGEAMQDILPENFDLTLYVEPTQPKPERGRPAGSARGRLSLAKSYLAAGMKAKAEATLVEIIENYPKSEHTTEAAKLLEGMRSKQKK